MRSNDTAGTSSHLRRSSRCSSKAHRRSHPRRNCGICTSTTSSCISSPVRQISPDDPRNSLPPIDLWDGGRPRAGVVGGGDRVATSPPEPLRGASRWHDSGNRAPASASRPHDSYRTHADHRARIQLCPLLRCLCNANGAGAGSHPTSLAGQLPVNLLALTGQNPPSGKGQPAAP